MDIVRIHGKTNRDATRRFMVAFEPSQREHLPTDGACDRWQDFNVGTRVHTFGTKSFGTYLCHYLGRCTELCAETWTNCWEKPNLGSLNPCRVCWSSLKASKLSCFDLCARCMDRRKSSHWSFSNSSSWIQFRNPFDSLVLPIGIDTRVHWSGFHAKPNNEAESKISRVQSKKSQFRCKSTNNDLVNSQHVTSLIFSWVKTNMAGATFSVGVIRFKNRKLIFIEK